jgi:hypothetical protein
MGRWAKNRRRRRRIKLGREMRNSCFAAAAAYDICIGGGGGRGLG